MALVLASAGLSVVYGLLRGGQVRRLAGARLRRGWLVAVAAAAQLAVVQPLAIPDLPLLVGSQVTLLAFLVANRRLRGVPLIAAGTAANAAVIVANGAMPVAWSAIRRVDGSAPAPGGGTHRLLAPDDRLPWLADVVPVPALGTVVSVGDLVLAAGVAVLVAELMRRPPPPLASGNATRPGWSGPPSCSPDSPG